MARNAERQMAMLNRWHTMKDALKMPAWMRQHRSPDDAQSVAECQFNLRKVIRDCGRKIAEIQNASLGEAKIRELNEEINKLLRRKDAWENRIVQLGGENPRVKQSQMAELMGSEIRGSDGYRYFGAARELPGVRELFEEKESEKKQKKRLELNKMIKADYFNWEKDDVDLLLEEAELERRLRSQALANE